MKRPWLLSSGFPEPFLRANERTWRRWQRERLQRILRDDLRDLEHVREVSLVELLLDALPFRVGAPLSIKSIRSDFNRFEGFRLVA